jgi:hypothetical protein
MKNNPVQFFLERNAQHPGIVTDPVETNIDLSMYPAWIRRQFKTDDIGEIIVFRYRWLISRRY